nr:DNA binding histon like protein [Cryptomonas tetrapyrenoidosa]
MNKKELISKISQSTCMTKKEIDLILTSTLEIIMDVVSEGEKVQLVGFGSFYTRKKILEKNSTTVCRIKFSSGKFFKEKVNVS